MVWKNWPFWLRGGIIALIIGIILTITLHSIILPELLNNEKTNLNLYESQGINYLIVLIFWLLFWPGLIMLISQLFGYFGTPVALLLGLVYYFIIGAIVGLIISKIKSKRRNN